MMQMMQTPIGRLICHYRVRFRQGVRDTAQPVPESAGCYLAVPTNENAAPPDSSLPAATKRQMQYSKINN